MSPKYHRKLNDDNTIDVMEGEGDLVEDAIDADSEIEEENAPIYETARKSTKFNEENAGNQTLKSTKDTTPKIAEIVTEKSSKYNSKDDDIQDNDAPDVKVMNNKSLTTPPCETQASRNDSTDGVTPPCFINSTLLQQKERIDTSAEKETSVGCADGSPALKTSTGTGKDILPPIKTLGGKDESCNPSLSQQSPPKELEQLPYKEIPPMDHPLTTTPPSDDQSTSMKQPPKRAASPHVPATSPHALATSPHALASNPHSPTVVVVQAKVSSEVSTTKTDKTNQKKDQSLKSAGFLVDNQNITGYATGFNNNNENGAFSDETDLITVPVSDVFIPKNEIINLIKDDNKVNAIPNDATSLVEETGNNINIF